jgi:hypothetical protein
MLRPVRTSITAAATLAAVLAAVSPARAADDGREAPVVPLTPDADDQPPVEKHWYGWQVLAADAGGLLATVGCVSISGADACLIPFLIAAPSVHLAHSRPMSALASVGLRVALPIVGAAIAVQAANCSEDEWLCGLSEMGVGVMIGTVAASVLDLALLSTETRERPGVGPSRLSLLSPAVSAGPNGASFGLQGRF